MTTVYNGADLYNNDAENALEMRPGLTDELVKEIGFSGLGFLVCVASFGPDGTDEAGLRATMSFDDRQSFPKLIELLQEHGYLTVEGEPERYRITGLTWATTSAEVPDDKEAKSVLYNAWGSAWVELRDWQQSELIAMIRSMLDNGWSKYDIVDLMGHAPSSLDFDGMHSRIARVLASTQH